LVPGRYAIAWTVGAHREIADWCDVDGRTEAQVLEVLDRAIAATGRPQ
jgi:Xaa-Pro aminopeptidase